MSVPTPKGALTSDEGHDIGTLLAVPEDQRLDYDDPAHEDANVDEGFDVSQVEDGRIVRLSTADLDDDDAEEDD